MGMGSATGWQRDRTGGEKVETVSQLNSFDVQMKTTKWMTAAVCNNKMKYYNTTEHADL